ncbi:TetR/AcrR family transcriptional regulator C-terminal domain-containing protein [Mycolicibacterium goodii]|uniref:TetR/AcrR family transcriptional regulator C-terminal domain-containing protein n=1 Tax=Mycolicibacterium goodii TaxID=134601 RepID=A0ABS6HK04_MYCGD|nr:TetR/AcrR family transcriptional regulator C-terminal domain-containing protein [Mycolicibacterium goodii]MBU8808341.1 TetR/AcrR family transcriptional regulator C-terminal domain-containing protein [Mycolicibacterium goodii]MBU8814646.1 TetR/AcrR family transcriptional regulator C-terminal domain-containing protein [Mycolicibacterium goodii]MBU8822915.1 TetR/AcrR family transcriptional regulator C-terminal domain-containing protein [Mycolicibacterium goodii]MBU8829243.1 TetR/AcrR family tra
MGRPSTPLLSTNRIATAALDLVNTTGGFTIPELARKLKVSPSSLYNHVAGREQIVELLRERAMSEVSLPDLDADRPWADVVADIMRSYRRSFARYPRLIPLLTIHAVNSTQAFRMYNALAVILRRAGFSAADSLRIITLIDNYVLGSALDLAAPDEPWEPGAEVGPALAAALATGAPKPDRADDAFEFGLAVLLRGLTNP